MILESHSGHERRKPSSYWYEKCELAISGGFFIPDGAVLKRTPGGFCASDPQKERKTNQSSFWLFLCYYYYSTPGQLG